MLENQIYSIESANINQETLTAIKNASDSIKRIHGNLTIDKVDQIMYVHTGQTRPPLTRCCREEVADRKALTDEIASAIVGSHAGDQIDEDELNEELNQLEQEQLDNQLLKTGTVPVLPSGPNAERESWPHPLPPSPPLPPFRRAVGHLHAGPVLTLARSGIEAARRGRRRGRGGGAAQAAGRDGHVGPGRHARHEETGGTRSGSRRRRRRGRGRRHSETRRGDRRRCSTHPALDGGLGAGG